MVDFSVRPQLSSSLVKHEQNIIILNQWFPQQKKYWINGIDYLKVKMRTTIPFHTQPYLYFYFSICILFNSPQICTRCLLKVKWNQWW